jgi:mannonate dehydratase
LVIIDAEKARALLDPDKARKSYYMAEDRRRDGAIVRP